MNAALHVFPGVARRNDSQLLVIDPALEVKGIAYRVIRIGSLEDPGLTETESRQCEKEQTESHFESTNSTVKSSDAMFLIFTRCLSIDCSSINCKSWPAGPSGPVVRARKRMNRGGKCSK